MTTIKNPNTGRSILANGQTALNVLRTSKEKLSKSDIKLIESSNNLESMPNDILSKMTEYFSQKDCVNLSRASPAYCKLFPAKRFIAYIDTISKYKTGYSIILKHLLLKYGDFSFNNIKKDAILIKQLLVLTNVKLAFDNPFYAFMDKLESFVVQRNESYEQDKPKPSVGKAKPGSKHEYDFSELTLYNELRGITIEREIQRKYNTVNKQKKLKNFRDAWILDHLNQYLDDGEPHAPFILPPKELPKFILLHDFVDFFNVSTDTMIEAGI